MTYARNGSFYQSFSETRDKFWKRLRVRECLFRISMPLFRISNTASEESGFYAKVIPLISKSKSQRVLSSRLPLIAVT